ncbi:MAG: bifunctional folylpolyglutamate synthase/dihydrofolate synthase [Bacteroidales bacterium]|nr:bifunctional folylpolyglutamate synthase/dihydrofolate synthase [Bacteroidales bacterium]MDT8374677.1 folylpolyglutamate synthase/dihydrofolate synthase family protein [Bacteroidales bacterium]
MTYQETVSYLYSLLPAYHRVGNPAYKGDLNNTLELDRLFGHPHSRYRTVHVAGTNGKGSVSHMIAAVMQAAGWRTGLYTSPHLKDFRERIKVDGQMMGEEDVISFVEEHDALIRRVQPSFFELTVAMAFDCFARTEVDVAVVEVGMGGRLDSTNIITPELSVITNIGHDHMEFLGETLAAVADEKAGIIKEGVPVVIGETQDEIDDVFRVRALAMNAPVTFADSVFRCSLGSFSASRARRSFRLTDLRNSSVLRGYTPLGGEAQQKNIQTVAAAVELLSGSFGLGKEHFMAGMADVVASTGLLGRWQVLSRKPLTVCDTGHNREGLEYVMKQIKSTRRKNLHMVIGFVSDKDLSSLLPLFPRDAIYYFTRASVPRALDEKLLMAEALNYGLAGDSYPSVAGALDAARAAAGPYDMIFIGGSTFIVGDAL